MTEDVAQSFALEGDIHRYGIRAEFLGRKVDEEPLGRVRHHDGDADAGFDAEIGQPICRAVHVAVESIEADRSVFEIQVRPIAELFGLFFEKRGNGSRSVVHTFYLLTPSGQGGPSRMWIATAASPLLMKPPPFSVRPSRAPSACRSPAPPRSW